MLLNTKERKVCFEAFIRSRAEEERKEKKSKLKEKKDQFRALLEESRLHPRYTLGYTPLHMLHHGYVMLILSS